VGRVGEVVYEGKILTVTRRSVVGGGSRWWGSEDCGRR
jgi:hypothetical protein